MVFLIDDNQNNQRSNNYNITYIEEGTFDKYLMPIEKIELKNDPLDISHLEFLKIGDCILLHATTEDYDHEKGFISGSKTNALKIKEVISREGEIVPLVLFSNSMGEAEFNIESNPHFIQSINKNVFYDRLFDFIEHYKNTRKIELRIIAWGKNFDAKEISRLAVEIFRAFELKSDLDKLFIADLSSVIKSFASLIELAYPKNSLDEIVNQMEDNPMKIRDFKQKINQIVESYTKYGKNIYPWK